MKIKPLADRVLINPCAAEEVTVSGIIIPDSAKEKPLKGTVLATGNGTKEEEMIVKEGDTVLYGKYAGTEIEVDGNVSFENAKKMYEAGANIYVAGTSSVFWNGDSIPANIAKLREMTGGIAE